MQCRRFKVLHFFSSHELWSFAAYFQEEPLCLFQCCIFHCLRRSCDFVSISIEYLIILINNMVFTATLEALNSFVCTIRRRNFFSSVNLVTCFCSWVLNPRLFWIAIAIFTCLLMLLPSTYWRERTSTRTNCASIVGCKVTKVMMELFCIHCVAVQSRVARTRKELDMEKSLLHRANIVMKKIWSLSWL